MWSEGAVASILAVSLAALGGRDPADCVACLGLAGAEVTDANGWLPGRLPFARAVVVQDGRIVGEHARSYGRDQTTFDPWHYVPVLARKPGALRNGAPFKDWILQAALDREIG